MAKRVGVGAVVYVETVWAMEGLHGTTTTEATAHGIRKTTAAVDKLELEWNLT